MGETRIVLQGTPYDEPRYYGKLQWSHHDVYIKHPGGGKDSRHRDGRTHLTSTDDNRLFEIRIPTSEVSREFVNYVELHPCLMELQVLRGGIRKTDIVLPTTSAGTLPRLAVEIVRNERLNGVCSAWESHSTAPNVQFCVDKGLGQSLVVAVAGSLMTPPSTSPY